jgi:TatD DNase family protein
MPDLIDIGANLTHESFDADRGEVMARAARAGVGRLIVTGADLAGSRRAHELCIADPARLWSTAGVHPHHARDFDMHHRDEWKVLLEHRSTVAVGECGLDYYRNFSPVEAQRAAFIAQLEIAVEAAKPVFLHQRDAHEDFVAILRDFAPRLARGVAHCFTGNAAELDSYLGLGLSIGITGWICDERRGLGLRDVVPTIPRDRLMIETDAPYLLPRDLRPPVKSRRNEPAFLPHVARTLARLRSEEFEDLAAYTTRNAEAFFALDI